MIGGGITLEDKQATPEVQKIIAQVKEQVESELNEHFDIFEAVSYRTQVVAGTNFFVKVCLLHRTYYIVTYKECCVIGFLHAFFRYALVKEVMCIFEFGENLIASYFFMAFKLTN